MIASENRIGPYEILELIGRGGMGRVFRGRDTRTGNIVAIKVLPAEKVQDDPGLLKRLQVESEALRLLNHPNIVKILEVIEEENEYSLILEYIDGGTLADLMRDQRQLPLEIVLKIALELADALSRAHHLKIIHRDIKPANILLQKDGTPRLTDFGLARMETSHGLTQTGAVIGSAFYLCPEVIKKAPPSSRMDLWSFGIVLYEMVTGRLPFEGDNVFSLINSIMNEPIPNILQYRPDTPPALADLIYQMLEKDPEKRPSSARRVGAELEAIIEKLDAKTRANLPSEIVRILNESRFDTPSKPYVLDTATTSDALADVHTVPISTQEKLLQSRPSDKVSPSSLSASPVSKTNNRLLMVGGGVTLLLIVLAAVVFLVFSGQGNEESSGTSDESNSQPIVIEAVGKNELMVLVAQLEPLGSTRPAIDRFILDDLRQTAESGATQGPLRIREYPAVVSSADQALQIAKTYNAQIVVWGNYTDEFIEIEISLYHPGEAALPAEVLAEAGNVKLRMASERDSSIAPYLFGAAAVYYNYSDDVYQVANALLNLADLATLPRAEITGVNVGALVYRYLLLLNSDTEAAIETINSALEIDPNNAILYNFRAAALMRTEHLSEAEQSANTAILFSDNRWSMPYMVIANVDSIRNDNPGAIEQIDTAIAIKPDQWLHYTMRGSYNYLEGNYEEASKDLQKAIELEPQANFPYILAFNTAILEGRIDDVNFLMDEILRKFPDPTYGSRIFEATGLQGSYGDFYPLLLSAFSNLVLRQYDSVIRDVESAIALNDSLPELFLFQGVAYCVNSDLESAEEAYTRGLELRSDLTVLYLLRADVRRQNDDLPGAFADLQAAQETPAWENFAALVSDPANANLGCESFFE